MTKKTNFKGWERVDNGKIPSRQPLRRGIYEIRDGTSVNVRITRSLFISGKYFRGFSSDLDAVFFAKTHDRERALQALAELEVGECAA